MALQTALERLREEADRATFSATKAQEDATQVADTYLRQGGRAWSTIVDAQLFDAVMILRAAAERLEAIRAAARATREG